MNRRGTFLALAAMALFSLQFASFASAMPSDRHAAQCCCAKLCKMTGHFQACCDPADPIHPPTILPRQHVVPRSPLEGVAVRVPSHEVFVPASLLDARSEAPQHSPPELYTLHSSLLI